MNASAIASPIGRASLVFGQGADPSVISSLSAVEQIGSSLWLAGDESHSIERLTTRDDASFGDHVSFELARFFTLPVTDGQAEVDLEGLAWDEAQKRLWLVGSHSWRRKQPRPDSTVTQAFERLRTLDRQANRYLLGSVLLDPAAQPVEESGQALQFTNTGNVLTDIL